MAAPLNPPNRTTLFSPMGNFRSYRRGGEPIFCGSHRGREWPSEADMLTYNLIGSGLVVLAAFSLPTARARAYWDPSARDETSGAQTAALERAPARDSDGFSIPESIELRRGLCELGNRPRRLSEQDLDLCILRSL